MADKFAKIRSRARPSKDLSRNPSGFQSPDLFSSSRKTDEYPISDFISNCFKDLLHKKSDVDPGSPHLIHSCRKVVPGPLKISSEFSPVLLGWPTEFAGSQGKDSVLDKEISTLVEGGRESSVRGPMDSESTSSRHYRRQQQRVGSPHRQPMASRCLAQDLDRSIIQSQGVGGCLGSPQGAKSSAPGKGRPNPVRQHHHGRLPEQAGGHKVQESLSPYGKDLRLGRRQHPISIRGSPKRDRQHSSGLPKPYHPPKRRMEFESRHLRQDYREIRTPSDRPLRLQSKPSSTGLLLFMPQGSATSSGCLFPTLEPRSPLCVSSFFPNSKSANEDPAGQSQGNPNRTFLAKKILVPNSSSDGKGELVVPSTSSGPSLPGSNPSSYSQSTPSHCLDAEGKTLRQKGLSDKVIATLQSSRKPITSKIYNKIWKTFQNFSCSKVFSSEVVAVLEFLQAGLERGLKPSTLKVQVSALSSALDKKLAEHPWIQRFIKAASRIHPRVHSTVPPWDLNLVLSALTSSPFEPLQDCSIRNLTLKTTFLLAITSARRVGEIQAFSCKPPYLSVLDDRIILRLHPTFLPKVVSNFHRQQEIILPSFCPNPSSDKEKEFHALDVRRCILSYLQVTESFRKSDQLLLQFQGPNKGQKASKITIARWIKMAISTCYQLKDKSPPAILKAHSTRAVATSWAESAHTSIELICKAATWSSPSTFFRHYKLDVVSNQDLSFGRRVLSAVAPP